MKDLTEAAREFVDALNLIRSKGSQKWMADLMAQFGQQQIDKALAAFVAEVTNRAEELGRGQFRSAFELVAEERGVEIQ